MTSGYLKRIVSVIILLLGPLLGVLGVSDIFDLSPAIKATKPYLVYVSILLLILALSVAFLSAIGRSFLKIRNWLAGRRTFTARRCNDDDICSVARLAKDLFGDYSTSLDETRRLHAINPRMFTIVKDKFGKTCGYYCMFRLTRAAIVSIERNEFNMANIPETFIRRDDVRNRVNVYIGAVYGNTMFAQGYIMGAVSNALREVRPSKVYARAATADGLRVLRRYDFKPLNGRPNKIGEIFCKEDLKPARVVRGRRKRKGSR